MATDFAQILSQENWVREHAGPLYSQLSQHLESAIRSGLFREGEALPSEREIAQLSKLSRVTVRKAVQELVRDGFVVQRQGSGTSIAPRRQKVEQSLSRLTSFSEDMERRGWISKSQWLERGVFSPSPEEMMVLGLTPSDNVARISRLRIADERPLAIEWASIAADILPDPENIGGSLYAHLAKSGNKPVRAVQRISAHILDEEDAQLLNVPEKTAGLRIERVSYLESGKVVEFTRSLYRGDAYDFVAELRIPEN
ncbi:MAG: GntR family transcriptional regulator [Rhizobiaceae bacterium]